MNRFVAVLVVVAGSFGFCAATAFAQTTGMAAIGKDAPAAVAAVTGEGSSPERQALLTNLRDIATAKCANPAGQVASALTAALEDGDSNVHTQALEIVAGCRLFARFMETPQTPVLKALRPHLIRSLRDGDPAVRREAVTALTSLDATGTQGRLVVLPRNTYVDLKGAYDTEPSPPVRSRIVQVFAQSVGGTSIQTSLLLHALNDPDDSVVRFAVHGVGEHRIADGMSKVGALLLSPNLNVRLAAPQALAKFGREALPLLPLLRQAIAVEPSDIVRKTMEGTEHLILALQ